MLKIFSKKWEKRADNKQHGYIFFTISREFVWVWKIIDKILLYCRCTKSKNMTFFRETKQDLGHYNKIRHITRGSITNGQLWHKSARKYYGSMYNAKTLYPKSLWISSTVSYHKMHIWGETELWFQKIESLWTKTK